MSTLSIKLRDNRETFAPGDVLNGEVTWQTDQVPKKMFLRLFWYTRGKGTEDIEVVSEIVFNHVLADETRPFKMSLPKSPYSFSGRLVSLIWALELVSEGNDSAVTREIVISPFGNAIDLSKHRREAS